MRNAGSSSSTLPSAAQLESYGFASTGSYLVESLQCAIDPHPGWTSRHSCRGSRLPILISRFHDLLGLGITTLLATDPSLEIVAAGVDPSELAAAIAWQRPMLAIVNHECLRTQSEIAALCSATDGCRLVVLGSQINEAEARCLMAYGATCCLPITVERRDLLHAIHLAARGLRVLSPRPMVDWSAPTVDVLTPREVDVLDLLRAGWGNREIATALHISVETVRSHVKSVYRKIGVGTRRELRQSVAPPA